MKKVLLQIIGMGIKKNKKYLSIIVGINILNILFPLVVKAVSVLVPDAGNSPDVAVVGPTQISGTEENIFTLIQKINSYLWFGVGLVSFALLVYAGFLLITSKGKDDMLKKAHNLLIGAIVGLFISMVSYAVVRLIVNII